MDIRIQSALLAAIIGLALAVSMLLRPGRPRVATLYSVFALIVSCYYSTQFLSGVLALGNTNPWLHRATEGSAVILGALIPSAALSFFLEFLSVSPGANRRGRRVALLSAIFGLAVGLTPLALNFWARVAVSVWVLGALLVSVSLLLHRMAQTESRIERARLRYLAIGALASILFSALDFLGRFQLPFPALGPVVTTLFLFFLAQTLLRLRLMDLHELLGKVASQTVLATILAVVFIILTAWVEHPSLFLFNTLVAAFVILILLEPLRVKVEERVVAIFFHERFELLRALSGLKAKVATLIDVPELSRQALDGFLETGRVTHASIYLLAEDRPGYRLLDARGPQPVLHLDPAAARGLLAAAASGQKALLLETIDRRIAETRRQAAEGKRNRDELKRLNEIRAAMIQMKAGITVPLVGNDRVLGFFNLWDERVPEAYASDEIALILELGEHIATVVENSKLYEKMRERDRLAALGEMAAGLAHEIRNPLGAIKGAAQCIEPRKFTGEDGEFLGVIIEEVNRLNGVVTAFLDYSRPLKQNFGPTDLNEVITRTSRLIQNELPSNVKLDLQLSESLPRVDADAEQLKQVLINLVQNAIQAIGTERSGNITLKTVRPERLGEFRSTAGDYVEIIVADDGPGIAPEQQPHIFVPFYTTKQKGTGLGLAISQRIVKSHSGSIGVESRLQEGTTFMIRLPALPTDLPSSLPPDGTPSPDQISAITLPGTESLSRGENRRGKRERKRRRSAPTGQG